MEELLICCQRRRFTSFGKPRHATPDPYVRVPKLNYLSLSPHLKMPAILSFRMPAILSFRMPAILSFRIPAILSFRMPAILSFSQTFLKLSVKWGNFSKNIWPHKDRDHMWHKLRSEKKGLWVPGVQLFKVWNTFFGIRVFLSNFNSCHWVIGFLSLCAVTYLALRVELNYNSTIREIRHFVSIRYLFISVLIQFHQNSLKYNPK